MTAEATTFETNQRPWWLILINGIAAVVISSILLFASADAKAETYLLLVTLLGIYWLLVGVFDIVSMFLDHTAWGWKLLMGLIGIMAGGWIITYPIAAAVVLPRIYVLVLGISGLMHGIVGLIMAFRGGGWGVGLLSALTTLFGIILIANYSSPGIGLTAIWVAAIMGLAAGILMIFQAFRQRSD